MSSQRASLQKYLARLDGPCSLTLAEQAVDMLLPPGADRRCPFPPRPVLMREDGTVVRDSAVSEDPSTSAAVSTLRTGCADLAMPVRPPPCDWRVSRIGQCSWARLCALATPEHPALQTGQFITSWGF